MEKKRVDMHTGRVEIREMIKGNELWSIIQYNGVKKQVRKKRYRPIEFIKKKA